MHHVRAGSSRGTRRTLSTSSGSDICATSGRSRATRNRNSSGRPSKPVMRAPRLVERRAARVDRGEQRDGSTSGSRLQALEQLVADLLRAAAHQLRMEQADQQDLHDGWTSALRPGAASGAAGGGAGGDARSAGCRRRTRLGGCDRGDGGLPGQRRPLGGQRQERMAWAAGPAVPSAIIAPQRAREQPAIDQRAALMRVAGASSPCPPDARGG